MRTMLPRCGFPWRTGASPVFLGGGITFAWTGAGACPPLDFSASRTNLNARKRTKPAIGISINIAMLLNELRRPPTRPATKKSLSLRAEQRDSLVEDQVLG